jgi:hypothetical protein
VTSKTLIFAALLIGMAALLRTESALAGDHEAALWLSATLDGAVNNSAQWSDLRYQLNVQARAFEAFDGARQANFGAGLSYRLPKRLSIATAYRHFHTQTDGAGNFHERRLHLQLGWTTGAWWDSTLRLRTRLEHRNVEERSGTAWRLRQQLRLDIPMDSWPGTDLVLGLEPFFELRDTEWTESGYTENRTFLGITRALTPKVRIETGYLYQVVNRSNRPDFNNHILVANFRYR